MNAAAVNGTWVLLQNCELGLGLMNDMEVKALIMESRLYATTVLLHGNAPKARMRVKTHMGAASRSSSQYLRWLVIDCMPGSPRKDEGRDGSGLPPLYYGPSEQRVSARASTNVHQGNEQQWSGVQQLRKLYVTVSRLYRQKGFILRSTSKLQEGQ